MVLTSSSLRSPEPTSESVPSPALLLGGSISRSNPPAPQHPSPHSPPRPCHGEERQAGRARLWSVSAVGFAEYALEYCASSCPGGARQWPPVWPVAKE